MKNFGPYQYVITIALIFVTVPIGELEGLFCHRCLSMDCPLDEKPKYCESVRDFIAKELRPLYHIGNYLEVCPAPDDVVQWQKREVKTAECESNDREATCSLGRIRVTTQVQDSTTTLVTHATILGCATLQLLKAVKPDAIENKCNDQTVNGTRSAYQHYLEIETCPEASTYCTTVDFCVRPALSVVKPYESQAKDTSFEYGAIIGIICAIVVLFGVVIAASLCRSPLNRSTNYSPTQVEASSNCVSSPTTSTSNGGSSRV